MATVGAALVSRLESCPGLVALVGTDIYRVEVNEGTSPPYVVLNFAPTERYSAFGEDTGAAHVDWRARCFGSTLKQAEDVREQVRSALQRWRGTQRGVTFDDVVLTPGDTEPDRDFDTQLMFVELTGRAYFKET